MMKLFLFQCVLLFFVKCAHSNTAYGNSANSIQVDPELDLYLKEAIENFRQQMKTGIPELNIPVLDPMDIRNMDIVDITIPDNLATVHIKARQILMKGLSRFRFNSIHPDMDRYFIRVNLSLPRVVSDGLYDLDMKFWNIFPVRGDVNFTTTLTRGVITGTGQLDFTGDTFQIRHMDMDLTFDDFRVDFKHFFGLHHWANILQGQFPFVVRNVFEGLKPLFLKSMNCLLKDEINKYFKKSEVKQIIQSMLSNDDE